MFRKVACAILVVFLGARAVLAQQGDAVWVQIEAQPSLTAAQDSLRGYATRLPDVNGFALGSGWYAIALGPYTPGDAEVVLRQYRSERVIPQDSFVAFSSAYRSQFWPVGANLLNVAPDTAPPALAETVQPETPVLPAALPDETRSEALASERALDRAARQELQIALQWAGFYTSAIDGAFGRGTRGAMADWQAANGVDPTGVLTTRQRATLLGQYNAVLEGMDLTLVRSDATGIEMQIPLGVVAFDRLDPPFAHYTATSDLGAQVLLISQAGNAATLTGLYDIMQTLEIVPLEGPRERRGTGFTLTGENAEIVSHTEARLEDGQIKGFTLIWPAGDEDRRARVLAEMQQSFATIDGVLDPAAGSGTVQDIDLVSGLEIRRPRLSRSGFYIDTGGTAVTTSKVAEGCTRLTLDGETVAEVVATDDALGIAILRPVTRIAPLGAATFQRAVPRLQSDVAVAGYSYGGILGAPTLTFGKLADLSGLRGEQQLKRLALAALPGDVGGPVFDTGGAVLGMLLPDPDTGQLLPDEVSFAADAGAIKALLDQAGISYTATETISLLPPEDLTTLAAGMTVLVSCWD